MRAGIPVMAHLGLTPQSVNTLGYRVQGRGDEAAHQLIRDAKAAQDAGAFALVLELVPAEVATEVTRSLHIPTIGIGAGPDTDAQVLVWTDMAGLTGGKVPRFTKQYARPAGDAGRRGEGVRRRRGRRGLPGRGAHLPLTPADPHRRCPRPERGQRLWGPGVPGPRRLGEFCGGTGWGFRIAGDFPRAP